jgi:hypothetical protein
MEEREPMVFIGDLGFGRREQRLASYPKKKASGFWIQRIDIQTSTYNSKCGECFLFRSKSPRQSMKKGRRTEYQKARTTIISSRSFHSIKGREEVKVDNGNDTQPFVIKSKAGQNQEQRLGSEK